MQCPQDRLLSSHFFLGDDVERISMRSGVADDGSCAPSVESGGCVVRKVGRRRWRKRIAKCFMIGVGGFWWSEFANRIVAATDKMIH